MKHQNFFNNVKKKKLLIHLFPYKFTNSDYLSRGFNQLEKKFNIKIITHELSYILYKNNNSIKINKTKRFKNTIKFTSLKKWKKNLNKLKKKNPIILNELTLDTFNSFKIHSFLAKLNLSILLYSTAGVIDYSAFTINFRKFYIKLKKIFINPYFIFFFLRKNFLNFLFNFIKFKKITFIYDVNNFKINLPYKIIFKKFKRIHSQDYSKFLIFNRNLKIKENKKIIFLDIPEPYFKGDDILLYKYEYKVDIKKWYKSYNDFFNFIENYFSKEVIIIPHPKTKGKKNPFYNSRRVDHRLDAAVKLIPSSYFVLSGLGVSTAISYAIASYKPIFLTHCDQAFLRHERQILHQKDVANRLGCASINIDSFKKIEIMNKLKVNKNLYDEYKYNYLTSKKLSNKPNHDIIGNLIGSL